MKEPDYIKYLKKDKSKKDKLLEERKKEEYIWKRLLESLNK